jgi:CcmD family protein
MYKKVCALLLVLSFWFTGSVVFAQDSTGQLKVVDSAAAQRVEMADQLRASGKIYVVVAVLVVILLGLILYVVRLDRKISRLEKEVSTDKMSEKRIP